ncbi:MAG: hypothetical protein ACOX3U_00905 [Christensenellales bacterium]|jgi:hypothetical protein
MEISKINLIVRCDMGLCGNKAVYSINRRNKILRRNINLCADCARKLYAELGKLFTPKSPENIIKKRTERGK